MAAADGVRRDGVTGAGAAGWLFTERRFPERVLAGCVIQRLR